MDAVVHLYHLLTAMPHWAWVALGVCTLLALVWLVIDIVSFILVSVAIAVLGGIATWMGLDMVKALF